MSVNLEKTELVALARDIHEGPSDFDDALRRCNAGFVKKLESKLWNDLKKKYPDRDFTGQKESRTRANITDKLKRMLKCKFFVAFDSPLTMGF